MAGCLSNIPPGGSTNHNERFHSRINTFFHKSQIGIFLAYALLTVIIYSYNSALTAKGKSVARPIAASVYRGISPTNLPSIGIFPKQWLQYQHLDGNEHWEIDVTDCQMDMEQVWSIYATSLQTLQANRSLAKMKLTNLKDTLANFKHFKLPVIGDARNLTCNC